MEANTQKKEIKKKGISVRMSYLLVGILPIIMGVAIIAFVLTSMLEEEIKDGIRNELEISANQVDEYFAYDVISNGKVDYEEYADHEYITSLNDNDIELTLFEKDVRVMTSLKNEQGGYNEGTTADPKIYEAVSKGENYSKENVKIGDSKYMVFYKPIYDGDGNFWGMAFAGEKQSKIHNTINRALLKVISYSGVLLAVFIVIILIIASKISKALTKTTKNIDNMAEGSLSENFNHKSKIKEFNIIMSAETEFQEKLADAVGSAKTTSEKLHSTAESVDKLSGKSAQGAEMITITIGELATTAQSMAETVQDANGTVIDMGIAIDNISENVKNMSVSSENSEKANKVATEYMTKLVEASENTAQSVFEISATVKECDEAAEKINAATGAITEISSQTNLLSLNASIEAARAGEAGLGFAVVAGEIQKLAEQSNESAIEIRNVITDIQNKVGECVTKTNAMTAIITEQMKYLAETKKRIDDMSKTGKEMTDEATLINTEVENLMKLKEVVLSAISDLSAISEENAASSQEVIASVEDISSAIDSTKEESGMMKELADELSERMEFFKI